MSKIFQNNIRQLNMGDTQGVLKSSYNCDLTYNRGKLSVSPKTILTTNNPTDFNTPVGFVYFDGFWWTVAGQYVWKSSSPTGIFTRDTSSGVFTSPTDCDSKYSDLVVFNGFLIVSTQTRIYRKTANGAGSGGWDVIDGVSPLPPLPSATVRPLAVYSNRLYWTRLENTIVSCDTSWAISSTSDSDYNITLPNNNIITFIKPFSTGLYTGVITNDGRQGAVFDWNGETKNTPRYIHNIYAQGALSCYVDNNNFYVFNSNAKLLRFNGAIFNEVGELPLKRDALIFANSSGSIGNRRFIHPNGMCLIDGKLSLLINGKNNNNSQDQDSDIPSGIYEYTLENGLYHKYSLSTGDDFGQISIGDVGGLADCPDLPNLTDSQKGNFLAGASFYNSDGNIAYGVFTDNYYDTLNKSAFFTTIQIRALELLDIWNAINLLYTPTNDFKFVVKYRTKRNPTIHFNITWVSSTKFTTTQSGINIGDEITITRGTGSGNTAHVTNVTFNSPNYEITVDETIPNTTGVGKAYLENWKKIGIITNDKNFFQEIYINQPSTLIELKVVMQGVGEFTLDELILINKKNK
jgi:hypothetical protein